MNVADSSGSFFTFDPPQLNDNSTLVFKGRLDDGRSGIFTALAGQPATTIAVVGAGGFTGFGGSFTGITAGGRVAFQGDKAFETPNSGIYTGDGGAPVRITEVEPSSPFSAFGAGGFEAINNNGTVAFFASRQASAGGGSGLFTYDAGVGDVATMADTTSGAFDFLSSYVSINEGGSVAFAGDEVGRGRGVFVVAPSGGVTTIADVDDGFAFIKEGQAINDAGMVAFIVADSAGGEAVIVGNGGALTTVVDSSGPYKSFQSVSINNAGTVAFDALLDDNRRGVFIGPDPVADKVILTGDTLFGRSLASVQFVEALNNKGEIAFLYGFNGARLDGVALAVIPEPSTLGLLTVAGLGCLRCWPPCRSGQR